MVDINKRESLARRWGRRGEEDRIGLERGGGGGCQGQAEAKGEGVQYRIIGGGSGGEEGFCDKMT